MSDGLPVIPASTQVPADPLAPISLDFPVHALHVGLIERASDVPLSEEWDQPAIYVLLGDMSDKTMPLYVGKAKSARSRLSQHRGKPPIAWRRAVVITRDTSHGFNSAEVGYLEGRLASELGARPGVSLKAGKLDRDETLPDHLLVSLDALLPTIFAALRVAGVPVVSAKDAAEATSRKRGTPRKIEGTVADLLAAGLLTAGTRLVFRRSGREATALVSASGSLIVDGVACDSPSMAGKMAFDLKAVNGWDAWQLADRDGVTLADLRGQLQTDGRG
jgi:hypothetical protein